MAIVQYVDNAVAVIPARGGSKRIPRKNLTPVEGKPMIAWVIEVALQSQLFRQVVVSSEDPEILTVAKDFGALPYQRPKELADDYTHVGPVVDDCLSALEIQSESVCLLYATAILLRVEHLRRAKELLARPQVSSVLAIAEFESPPQRAYEISDQGEIALAQPEFFNWRSQDLPRRFRDTGMFSWWKREPGHGKPFGLLMPKLCAVDIDTPDDLALAVALFSIQQR